MQTRLSQNDWPILIVGDYLFEPTIGFISGPGGAHHVCARTSALLLYLAEHRNELVDRNRLITELWHNAPGASKGLNQSVARLRHYFDDNAQTARYIETVPSRGYRLVAAVYESKPGALACEPHHPARGRVPVGRNLGHFILEMRNRKVCRAMLVYFIVAWLAAQVAEIVTPALGLPEWFTSFIVVLGLLGFPITAVLAWIFEITPEGLVIDVQTRSNPAVRVPRSRSELIIDTTLIVAAVMLAAQLLDKTFLESGSASGEIGLVAPATLPTRDDVHTIAVSPFSVNTADESVAVAASEVMHQIIRTLMSRDEFVVVSGNATNTSHGDDSFRSEVDCVLTGVAFNRDGDIRVSIYLRDARSDAYLLSKVFEQPLLDDAALAAEIEQTAVEILRAVQGTEAGQPDVPRLDVKQPAVAGSLHPPFSGAGRTSTASGRLPGSRPAFTVPGSAFL